MLRVVLALMLAGSCAGCVTDSIAAVDSPDIKSVIVANKASLLKEPASIVDAAISQPKGNSLGWQACLTGHAKTSSGAIVARAWSIQIYRNGATPTARDPAGRDDCAGPFEPFPEVVAGYTPPVTPTHMPSDKHQGR